MSPRPPLPIGHHGVVSVVKLPTGSWRARTRYRDPDGITRLVEARGRTKGAAQTELYHRLDDRPKVAGAVLTPDTPVRVLAEAWYDTLDVSGGSRDTYRKALDSHILPRAGAWRIREVTTARVEGLVRGVEQKRQTTVAGAGGRERTITLGGPTAARRARTILSMMMDLAARHDATTGNPVRSSRAPKINRAPVSALAPGDVHALRAHVHTWAREKQGHGPRRNTAVLDMLDVLIGTGLRPGEVLGLRWSDIDLKAGTLTVSGTVVRTKDGGLHRQEHPKSQTSGRTLAMPQFAVDVLRRRRAEAASAGAGGTAFGGLVFPSRAGGLWEPANASRAWRAARAGGWEQVELRHLRRAVATLVERELGMDSAAAQLGHSSPEVTRRHYVERAAGVDVAHVIEAMRAGE
ncbi:tyrosine-type recombinase/integrase [Kocuria rosea]|uniref:tyrosine-type recombinase/integrase n=1 Tax=Kocuria rosea TaxID=1275 RepID=UPI003D3421B3